MKINKHFRLKMISLALTGSIVTACLNLPVFAEELTKMIAVDMSDSENSFLLSEDFNLSVPDDIYHTLSDEELLQAQRFGAVAPEYSFDMQTFGIGEEEIIDSAEALTALSKRPPSEYQTSTIVIKNSTNANEFLIDDDFEGLGSDEFPFRGTIRYAEETRTPICLKRPLFNAVYDSMAVTTIVQNDTYRSNLRLQCAGVQDTPLFADKVCHDPDLTEPVGWTIELYPYHPVEDITGSQDMVQDVVFGGLIGTVGENCLLGIDLNVNYRKTANIIEKVHFNLSGTADVGLFCGYLGKNSSLSVSYSADNDEGIPDVNADSSGALMFSVTANSRNAGSLVGAMDENSSLTIKSDLSYSGTVSAGLYGGGLVGCIIRGENGGLSKADGVKLALSPNVSGVEGAGGYIGYVSSESGFELDVSADTSGSVLLSTSKFAGGLIGWLNNKGAAQAVNISVGKVGSAADSSAEAYGGLIGKYTAADLASALNITCCAENSVSAKKNTSDSTITNFGGIIGRIEDCTDRSPENLGSYVNISGAALGISYDIPNNNNIANFGGIVGSSSDSGNFLDINCAVNISTTNTGYLAETSAGCIAGNFESGVIRLNGAVDLTGNDPRIRSTGLGWLLGMHRDALVCKTANCTITRGNDYSINDIGNWGAVVSIPDSDTFFSYDSAAHTMTIPKADNTISDNNELYSLALNIQLNNGADKGALCFEDVNSPHCTTDRLLAASLGISESAGDLSFVGSGITGLMRDDGTQTFVGGFDGKNKTITLEISDGIKLSGSKRAIYTHTHSGLFAKAGENAYICNLKINGDMLIEAPDITLYGGGIIGEYAGRDRACADIRNVSVSQNIVFKNNDANNIAEAKRQFAYVGGMIGKGIGNMKFRGGCRISCDITTADGFKAVRGRCGGLVAAAGDDPQNANTAPLPTKISIVTEDGVCGLTVDGANIHPLLSANGYTGGFLGAEWFNTDVELEGLKVTQSDDSKPTQIALNKDVRTNFGGLVYQASGHWQIKDLEYEKAAFSAYPNGFGLIAYQDIADKLYLELITAGTQGTPDNENKQNNYRISENDITFDLNNVNAFDEFIYNGKNSIVSIPTSDGGGLMSGSTPNVYYNRTAYGKTRDNVNTRYYYNIDTLRTKVSEGENISDGEELLLWSIQQYTEADEYFFAHKMGNEVFENTDCDLTGLSYYPVNVVDDIYISNTIVTFDSRKFSSNAAEDAVAADCQHEYIQSGLFFDIKASATENKSKTVTVSKLTLRGPVGRHDSGSGALVCGKVEGAATGTNIFPSTLECTMNAEITLDGVYVRDYTNSDYAPLLINKADSYSNCTIIGVKTSAEYAKDGAMGGQTFAGSSLMGNAGTETAVGVNLTFGRISLDPRVKADGLGALDSEFNAAYNTKKSIFSRATLLNEFRYELTDQTSSGKYDFSFSEDWKKTGSEYSPKHNVTYGFEITGSVENFENQLCYIKADDDPDPDNVYFVTPVKSQIGSSAPEYAFNDSGKYRFYVYRSPASDENIRSLDETDFHELDVNLSQVSLSQGCGTYGDPYIITDGRQLQYISKIITSKGANISNNEKMCFPIPAADKTFDNCIERNESACRSELHKEYTLKGSKFVAADDSTITRDQAAQYVQNAYYLIQPAVTDAGYFINVPSNFKGIGSDTNVEYTFRGVIVGAKTIDKNGNDWFPDVNMNCDAPLIKISSGAVVKNLNINYKNDVELVQDDTTAASKKKFYPYDGKPENVDGCEYWGGVIGQVLAGDNVIDNVNVTFAPDVFVTISGNHDYLIPVGAYVGVIRNGGLILRNMTNKVGFNDIPNIVRNVDSKQKVMRSIKTVTKGIPEETKEFVDIGGANQTDYLYVNPFIGRVLDGFAVCDDGTVAFGSDTNGTKNYTIAPLFKPDENPAYKKISLNSGKDGQALVSPSYSPAPGKKAATYSAKAWSQIQLPDAQSLFVLSSMVASGACAYEFYIKTSATNRYNQDGKIFGKDTDAQGHFAYVSSYDIGRTRLANYTNVGNLTGTADPDFVTSTKDRSASIDKSQSDDETIPYLIYYYTENQDINKNNNDKTSIGQFAARVICGSFTRFSLKLSTPDTLYDMSRYGSAFHGLNAMFNQTSYLFNFDRQVINTYGFDGNGSTIKLGMDVKNYGSLDPYNPFGVGLFSRFQQNASADLPTAASAGIELNGDVDWNELDLSPVDDRHAVKDLTLTGSVKYQNYRGPNTFDLTFENTTSTYLSTLKNLHVNTGAFTGRNYEGRDKYTNNYFKNVKLGTETEPMIVDGGYYSGGLIGGCFNLDGNGTYNFIAKNISSDGLEVKAQQYAGGVAGYLNHIYTSVMIDGGEDNNFKIRSVTAENLDNICGGVVGNILNEKHPKYGKNLPMAAVRNINVSSAWIGAKADVGMTNTPEKPPQTQSAGGLIGRIETCLSVENCRVNDIKLNSRKTAAGATGFAKGIDVSRCYIADCDMNINGSGTLLAGGIISELAASYVDSGLSTISDSSVSGIGLNIASTASGTKCVVGGLAAQLNNASDRLTGYDLYFGDNTRNITGIMTGDICFGNWIGSSNGLPVKLVGISRNGPDLSEKDIGSGANSEDYFIYADYNNVSRGVLPTPNNLGIQNTGGDNDNEPYVNINPSPLLADIAELGLYGDAFIPDNIIKNAVDILGNEKTGEYTAGTIFADSMAHSDSRSYSKVSEQADKFFTKSAGGDYTGKLMKYREIDNNEVTKENFPKEAMELPVLLIEDDEGITDMVNDYISVLTNFRQTAEDMKYFTIVPHTYTWNGTSFAETVQKPSLTYRSGNIRITPGQYDNQRGQFTVLDVQYTDPAVNAPDGDTPVVYHLYIPIFVKKLLEFSCVASNLPGTDFLESDYLAIPEDDRLITSAGHGVPLTSLITFTYHRTPDEWVNAINSGENEKFAFNKCVWLSPDSTTVSEHTQPLPPGTQFTLVDLNDPSKFYKYSLTDENYMAFFNSSGYLRFEEFTNVSAPASKFRSDDLLLCDLLCQSANVTMNASAEGGLIETTDTAAASFRIPKQDGGYTYYRPYDENEFINTPEEQKPARYNVSITAPEGYDGADFSKDDNFVKDKFYLTIQTPKDSDAVIKNTVNFTGKLEGADSDSLPTYNISSRLGFNWSRYEGATYLIGNFFSQDFSVISPINNKLDNDNHIIEAQLSAVVEIKNSVSYWDYAATIPIYHEFGLSFLRNTKTVQNEPDLIEAGVHPSYTDYKIRLGTKDQTTGEITWDSEYITIAPDSAILDGSQDFTHQSLIDYIYPLDDSHERVALPDNIRSRNVFEISATMLLDVPVNQLSTQFPSRELETDIAIGSDIKVYSNIGWNAEQLHSTPFSITKTDAPHYYVLGSVVSQLTYSACEVGSNQDGNTSQLGINAFEEKERYVTINAVGMLDTTNYSELLASKGVIKTVRFYLQLERKKMNSYDYEAVDIGELINKDSVYLWSTGDPVQAQYDAVNHKFYADFEWTAENEESNWFEIWTTYDVLTGDIRDKGNDSFQDKNFRYANYRVTLTADLLSADKDDIPDDLTDVRLDTTYGRLIYTNAKIDPSLNEEDVYKP